MPPVNRKNPVRAASSESQYSLMEFMREYPDDDSCLEALWRRRYSEDGTHAECPRCGQEREFKRYETKQQRQSWSCVACSHKLHPTAGTIFHKSSTSLHLWFYAMYLMTSTRCGISAKQLERELGVTYKTAWRMAHLIRHRLMTQETDQLSGKVEADETLVGGRVRASDHRPRTEVMADKAKVFAAVERGGKVRADVVPNSGARTLHGAMHRFVLPTSDLYTDEYAAYVKIGRAFNTHSRIRHKAMVYV